MSRTNVRDEGLRRIGRLTGWVAALGVAGTGFLAAVVSTPRPDARPARRACRAGPAAPSVAPTGSGPSGRSRVSGPAVQAPVPVQQVPIVRSGAS